MIFLLTILCCGNLQSVSGQSALGQLETLTNQKVDIPKATNFQPVERQVIKQAAVPQAQKISTSRSISTMATGMLIDGLINSFFSTPSSTTTTEELMNQQRAKELQEEQQRLLEEKAQSDYESMMELYKQLDGAEQLKVKALNQGGIDLKNLEGDAEKLSAEARKQFEGLTVPTATTPPAPGSPTPFFGDTMPIEAIELLYDPANDPNVVDLRSAKSYLEGNIENDKPKIVSLLRLAEPTGNGQPIIQTPDCQMLEKRLKGYLDQREKFRKTIEMANNELTIWETANRNALINAAKDGLSYLSGKMIERLSKRAEAAERLQMILDKNAKQMTKEGIDILAVQGKINRLKQLSTANQLSDLFSKANDWNSFTNNAMSSLVGQLTASNQEMNEMMQDSVMQKYFATESSELNTLLDISKIVADSEILGKWVAKKLPLIAAIELGINQTYNAFDWLLSYQRLSEAHKIGGGVEQAARYIQRNIDKTYSELALCGKTQ